MDKSQVSQAHTFHKCQKLIRRQYLKESHLFTAVKTEKKPGFSLAYTRYKYLEVLKHQSPELFVSYSVEELEMSEENKLQLSQFIIAYTRYDYLQLLVQHPVLLGLYSIEKAGEEWDEMISNPPPKFKDMIPF